MKTKHCSAVLGLAVGVLMAQTAPGADVRGYGVFKGQDFSQTSAAAPVLETAYPPYSFTAIVQPSGVFTNQVTAASVQPTNRFAEPLTPPPAGSTAPLAVFFNAVTQAAVDAAYPNGIFVLSFGTAHDGNRRVALNLPANSFPASAPRVANFSEAQAVNPTGPFTLRWDAFTAGTSNDYIGLQIYDAGGSLVFRTASFGAEPGLVQLNGTNTSVTIPGGTLQAGQAYSGYLFFEKDVVIDSASTYPGVLGLAGFSKGTSFPIRTLLTAGSGDVSYYGVFKGQEFVQMNSGAPTPNSSFPSFSISAVVQPNGAFSGQVSSATLQRAGDAVLPLSEPAINTPFPLVVTLSENSQATLDTAYPAGRYTLAFDTAHDGHRELPLDLPTNTFPASPPHVANFAAAQMIPARAPFTLRWDAFANGTAQDFIAVGISDASGRTVFRTATFKGELGYAALNGTATSVTIPAGTLNPDQVCSAFLRFEKDVVTDTTGYPGALGLVGFYQITRFNVTTLPAATPYLEIASVSNGGAVALRLTGDAGRQYAIQSSANLVNPVWTSLTTNTAVNGVVNFTNAVGSRKIQFYRGLLIP